MLLRRRRAVPARPPRAARIGSAAADLTGTDPGGTPVHRSVTGDAHEVVLLLFLTSSCQPCRQLWRALSAGEGARLPGGPQVVVVTPGAALEDRRQVAALAPPATPVVMSGEAWVDYAVPGSPFAVLVRAGWVAGEGPVRDWAELVALLSRGRPARGAERAVRPTPAGPGEE